MLTNEIASEFLFSLPKTTTNDSTPAFENKAVIKNSSAD